MDNMRLIFYSLQSLLKVLFFSRLRLMQSLNKCVILKENSTLRILGNGKSLNESLSSFENGFDYMVVNRHILSDSYESLQPKYYVLADPYFFQEEGLDIIKKINTKTMWPMIVFYPQKYEISQFFKDNKNIKIMPYNNTSVKGGQSLKNILYNKNLAMPNPQNVLVAAIYCAVCIEYKRIELYGVEHSWTKYLSVNKYNEVCLENPHFFDIKKEVKTWKEIQGTEAYMHDVLRAYANMFESYIELKTFAKSKKVDIINYTQGSFIDAFRRNVEM